MLYEITRDYIGIGNARQGEKLSDVKFIVAHDTGNPGASAYANRNYFENTDPFASAHTFIDDENILEIIPLDEKAFHVRSNVPLDNKRFGGDANDVAIGVELAWGGNIDFWEAYNRYVWYFAYLVDKYNLNPEEDIIAHSTLDPGRRTDPQNALNRYGITWARFIDDVKLAYQKYFQNEDVPEPVVKGVSVTLPIEMGATGEFVKEIQGDLIRAGFALPIYGADGIFGPETQRAVMKFQKAYGINVTGQVDPFTLDKLKDVVGSSKPINVFELPDGILQRGDEGPDVKRLQRALKAINFDPKYIDGIYGPLTEDAVKRFQSMYSALKNDGIFGPNTKQFLEMELDDL
jgi:N-acetylmuramoyl-L-alanine amidase